MSVSFTIHILEFLKLYHLQICTLKHLISPFVCISNHSNPLCLKSKLSSPLIFEGHILLGKCLLSWASQKLWGCDCVLHLPATANNHLSFYLSTASHICPLPSGHNHHPSQSPFGLSGPTLSLSFLHRMILLQCKSDQDMFLLRIF